MAWFRGGWHALSPRRARGIATPVEDSGRDTRNEAPLNHAEKLSLRAGRTGYSPPELGSVAAGRGRLGRSPLQRGKFRRSPPPARSPPLGRPNRRSPPFPRPSGSGASVVRSGASFRTICV